MTLSILNYRRGKTTKPHPPAGATSRNEPGLGALLGIVVRPVSLTGEVRIAHRSRSRQGEGWGEA
jgi:hypothetical protein